MNDTNLEPMKPQAAAADLRYVGIAASAGGLEAVSLLAQNLSPDIDAVYIVAQHMSPTYKSLLSSLLSRETKMPVVEIGEDLVPQAATIYVTPPNKDVILEAGMLCLREPAGHFASPKPSGDRLFKSLAEEAGENCLGIVLSGTGSDGSYGVQAIREAGGITIAQDPASAKYDGMPSSAIETGCIDLSLSPDAMGQHLKKILENPRDLTTIVQTREEPLPFQDLYSILLARTNVDFREYKKSTTMRRISRRMAALGIDDYQDYTERCRVDEAEVEALFRDMLISVTRFFRDPDQFEYLRRELMHMVQRKDTGQIRVWVIGCATGEEAYSIAITLIDLLGGLEAQHIRRIRIFATDIDQNAINIARRGSYPVAAAQDIPKKYLDQYFVYSETGITVRSEVREVVLFSHHNAFQDPPFVNLDLVSVRNVLIYFNQALQERVLSRIHYALASDGLLFLGLSETVGDLSIFFQATGTSDKILSKRVSASKLLESKDQAFYTGIRPSLLARSREERQARGEHRYSHEGSLISAVAETGFVTTRDGHLIEIIGNVTPFARIDSETPGLSTLKILVEPLRIEAQSMIHAAARKGRGVKGRWHQLETLPDRKVQMQVFPFARQSGEETVFLLGIETSFEVPSAVDLSKLPESEHMHHIRRLEQELEAVREALQQNIEELQTTNEELQSANEELQSTNEEFQATNEELETSNEELQSTNEELLTVNEELQVTSSERQELTMELEATLLSAPYAMLFSDVALMVRRMSQPASEMFNLRDIPPSGVHLSQAALPKEVPPLAPLANEVLRLQESRVLPITVDGNPVTMTVSPVSDVHGKPMGVVILLVPEFDSGGHQAVLDLMSEELEIGHWTYRPDTEELVWSETMFDLYGRDREAGQPTLGDAHERIHPDDAERVTLAFSATLHNATPFRAAFRVLREDGSAVSVHSVGVPVKGSDGGVSLINGATWTGRAQAPTLEAEKAVPVS